MKENQVRTATYKRVLDPKIYVASLSDYNDGELHGVWIDLDGKTVDDIQQEIDSMLAASPFAHSDFARAHGLTAEEYAIHDHEGFGGNTVGEWTNIDAIAAMAELICEHDQAGAAFFAHADDYGWAIREFSDRYRGQWPNFSEFAQELFDDVSSDVVAAAADNDYLVIDYDRFARDIASDYAIVSTPESVFVFDAAH